MKIPPEEVVAMLSKPELQDMLSNRGNAVVDTILEALYTQIETRKPVKICPECGAENYVIESRETGNGSIRRRRECPRCKHRFSTIEVFYEYKKG